MLENEGPTRQTASGVENGLLGNGRGLELMPQSGLESCEIGLRPYSPGCPRRTLP
jgi:hypothetical protein